MNKPSATSNTPTEDKADVYAARERVWMVRTQQVRARLFAPLLRFMARVGLKPDHLTALSLIAGVAACPLLAVSPLWALVAIALHILIDGLDGPLARYLGTASRKGSFTDSMADQLVVTLTTVSLIYLDRAGWLPGLAYVMTYAVVVLFAMARNALNVPYTWLVRPRFYVYAWIGVEYYWLPGTIDFLLWVCSALLAVKVLTGFLGIRRSM